MRARQHEGTPKKRHAEKRHANTRARRHQDTPILRHAGHAGHAGTQFSTLIRALSNYLNMQLRITTNSQKICSRYHSFTYKWILQVHHAIFECPSWRYAVTYVWSSLNSETRAYENDVFKGRFNHCAMTSVDARPRDTQTEEDCNLGNIGPTGNWQERCERSAWLCESIPICRISDFPTDVFKQFSKWKGYVTNGKNKYYVLQTEHVAEGM